MNKITTQIIEQLYNQTFKAGRKNSYPISHYIEVFRYVLKTGIAWRDLKYPLHWNTYYKKFISWTKAGIFYKLHSILLQLATAKKLLSKQHLQTLFIDSTMIKNFKGVDLLGKNHYDRNRKGNKITLVCSTNGIPLSISLTSANTNDQMEVIPAINKITLPIKKSTLVADGAYVSNKLKTQLKSNNIKFIYPYKKNQHLKNTQLEISLLKKRYIVENVFSWIQNLRRLRHRYDRKAETFIQFYYFGLAEVISRKIKN